MANGWVELIGMGAFQCSQFLIYVVDVYSHDLWSLGAVLGNDTGRGGRLTAEPSLLWLVVTGTPAPPSPTLL